jgi:hypothetical protein
MNSLSPVSVSRARPLTKGEAKRELTAWSSSGLTLAAYARERGIPEKRFWNWHTRLRSQGWEPGMAVPDAGAGLVPARIVDGLGPVVRSSFEVSLGTGIVIRVPPDFEKGALRRLLDVVSEC